MNNLLKKIDESIEFNSKERPHLPEINIGLYIAREIIQGEQKRKRPIKASKGEEEYNGCPICKKLAEYEDLGLSPAEIKELDKYLEFKQLQLDSLIKQAIDNCFMTHKYEYPGMERGLCAGLRKQNGEGELTEVCKKCKFNYIWEEENQN